MTVTSGMLMNPQNTPVELAPVACQSAVLAALPRYRNSVWDTEKAGDDKTYYWNTSPDPDPTGSYYDGPGTWGVHTSGHSVIQINRALD